MKTITLIRTVLCCAVLAVLPGRGEAHSGFNYAGKLFLGKTPANGVYELQFTLWDAPSNGALVVPTVLGTPAGVTVVNGEFSVILDFGADAFDGEGRWLEISARLKNTKAPFTKITPRQPLAVVPMAVFATTAERLAAGAAGIVGTGHLLGGSVTAAKLAAGAVGAAQLANNAVTGAKVQPGHLVRSLNGLTDVVTLAAGTNVVLRTNGNTLTVSAGLAPTTNAALLNGTNRFTGSNTFAGVVRMTNAYNQINGAFAGDGAGLSNVTVAAARVMGTLGAAQIGAGAIGTAQLAAGAVQTANLANGAVGGAQLAANAVDTAQLADGAVTVAKLRAGQVVRSLNGLTDSVTLAEGTNVVFRTNGNTLTVNADFTMPANVARLDGTNRFTGSNTFAGVVLMTNANNQINGAFAGDGGGLSNVTVAAARVTGTLGAAQIGAGAVGATQLAAGAVNNIHIAGGGVHSTNLADSAVGSAQLAANAVQAANLANGAVGNAQMAVGAAAANLAAGSQSPVGSGGLVLSATESAALVAAGYAKLGSATLTDVWMQRSTNGAPTPRALFASVWTGKELIVWGGQGSVGPMWNNGGRYNPSANTWTALNTNGAPIGRIAPQAVWTGTEMIVWGGYGPTAGLFSIIGGRYDPATDTWSPMATNGAPTGRTSFSMVWTGSEVIIWGGAHTDGPTHYPKSDGARYNPVTDTWTPLTLTSPPRARSLHSTVWTGTEMIIWGGHNWVEAQVVENTGGRYNPSTDSWTATTMVNAPSRRYDHTAVWSGSEMIVWGGVGGAQTNTGARYNPSTDSWTATPVLGAPVWRNLHTAVWTGTEMIVWGGNNRDALDAVQFLNDGGRYDPMANKWSPLTMIGAAAARRDHTAVWTGSEMLVWGGWAGGSNHPADLGSYSPTRTLLLYQRP